MKTNTINGRSSGFTLTEVMVAMAVMTLLCASVFAAFTASLRWTRAGNSQTQFMANARVAGDNILGLIEKGKRISVPTNGNSVKILFPDLSWGTIYFSNSCPNVSLVESNSLQYDPGTGNTGDIYVLCTYVRPVDPDGTNTVPIFTPTNNLDPLNPKSVVIRFHVGDGTNVTDASFSGTGQGYQGTEVRMSATPRNDQKWYTE
jgi:prepilin-type N-terminal cleavage/methylation domain-containing protein